jgi:hypothetical protein
MPTLLVIHKLAAALGTTMADLMAEVEADAPPADEPPPIPRGRPPRPAREAHVAEGEQRSLRRGRSPPGH